MHKVIKNSIGKKTALLMAGMLVSACVSDTLSTVDTQPQPVAETPKYDPIQREQAIAEIRAKADQSDSSELTNAFAQADGPNEPLTAQEQAQKTAELKSTAAQNEAAITDPELVEKQRSILEMQKKAKSHYGDAIKTIKN